MNCRVRSPARPDPRDFKKIARAVIQFQFMPEGEVDGWFFSELMR